MGGNEKPTLDRRNRTAQRERANILLAGALMLAVLIVVGAAVLTLAPTGSDGTSGHSPSSSDVETLEAGLEPIFIESYDLFTDEVPPPQASQERPPIDPETATELLESQPFTDRQLTETVEWLLALANQDTSAGDIATLEATNETQTGTLIRLGNDGSHDFAGEQTTLVENAETLQDLVVVVETATLPHETQDPFELRIGDWKMEAYQENGTSDTIYRVDGLVGGGPLTTSDSQLRLDFSDNTINGVPVPGNQSLAVDPGREEFDITVSDTPATDESNGTHGGLNIVASGGEATIPPAHTREVVTHAGFKATYLDDATTYTSHLTVPAQYTALDVEPCDCERSEYTELVLDVETEDADALTGIDDENIWFPAYHAQSSEYELVVTERALNGTVLGDRTADADVTAHSSDCDECVTFNHSTASGAALESPERTVATPHNLTEQLRINATVENRTVTTNVTVHDPYREADLSVADTLTVGQTVTDGAFTLTPYNTTQTDYEVGLDEMASVEFVATEQVVTGLAAEFGVASGDEALIGDAITQFGEIEGVGNITDFINLPPDEQAAVLGYEGDDADTVADFFETIDAGQVTISDDVWRLDHLSDDVGAIAALFADSNQINSDAGVRLVEAVKTMRTRGPGIQPHYLYEIADEDGIVDQDSLDIMADLEGYTIDPPSAGFFTDDDAYREAFFRFIHWYATDPREFYQVNSDWAANVDLAIENELDEIENIDGGQYITDLSSFPAWLDTPHSQFHDEKDFRDLSDAHQDEYLWLAGVRDAEMRSDAKAFADALGNGLEIGWDELFTVSEFELLDTDALTTSDEVTLADPEKLLTDWNLTVEATYDGYEFADYTATNSSTVVDPMATIDRIDIDIVQPGTLDPLIKHEEFDDAVSVPNEPLVIDRPAEVHATVTHTDNTTDVNPDYLDWQLVEPVENVTSPDEFATLNTSTNPPTLTATNRTGPMDEENIGPIVVEAQARGVTGVSYADAMKLKIDGAVTFDADEFVPSLTTQMSEPPDVGIVTHTAIPGLTYELLWGANETSDPIFEPLSDRPEEVNDISWGFDSWESTDDSGWIHSDSWEDRRMVINSVPTSGNLTFYGVNESKVLGIQREGEQRFFKASGNYTINLLGGGGGGGGVSNDLVLSHSLFNTNWQFPDDDSSHMSHPTKPLEFTSLEVPVEEERNTEIQVRNNFKARFALFDDSNALVNGKVDWRPSRSECEDAVGQPCLRDPLAYSDFNDGHESNADLDPNVIGPASAIAISHDEIRIDAGSAIPGTHEASVQASYQQVSETVNFDVRVIENE